MPRLRMLALPFLILILLSGCGDATEEIAETSSGPQSVEQSSVGLDCDALIHDRHLDQKSAIYQWQTECMNFDPSSFAADIAQYGIVCVLAARPPADAQPSARVWGTTCFGDRQPSSGQASTDSQQTSQRDYDAQTRRCVDLALHGASDSQLSISGCSYANRDEFDGFAVEQAMQQYQRNYRAKTAYCRDLILDGASSTALLVNGCSSGDDFDRNSVDQARRDYEREYGNQTDRCADLARQGASSTTMMLNNCNSASPGVGTDFDEWQVQQAERDFEREQEQREYKCEQLERSGAQSWELSMNGCN